MVYVTAVGYTISATEMAQNEQVFFRQRCIPSNIGIYPNRAVAENELKMRKISKSRVLFFLSVQLPAHISSFHPVDKKK